jgi:putative oxidoreductase
MDNLCKRYFAITDILKCYLAPLFALGLRLIIFRDFFVSGWLKLSYLINGQWDTVIYLFSDEYKVPILSPQVAAVFGTFNEVTFPILILLGLATRFSGIVIFFIALIIELTFMQSPIHILWMISAIYLVIYGPGMLSLDHYIAKKVRNN